MADIVLNLDLQRSRPRSPYHDLFLQVSQPLEPGQWWRIKANEFSGPMETFRTSLQTWARTRDLYASTKVRDGCLFVRMVGRV